MALPNLTAINIYLADNTLWRTIELAGDCKYIDELEGDERVELKWESYDYEKIPVGSYVIYDNRVFRLTEPHEPSRRMENVFTYSPTFYTESYHWRKAMACYYEYSGEVTYTNSDNTISANIPEPTSRELDWSFTGNLPDALFMLLQAIKNETGSVWKAHYDSSVANQLIEITAQGLSVRDMLTQIADQCGKEFYFDYSGATPVVNIGTLELTASGEHTEDGRIVLNIGEDVGNPTVNSEAEEYFTRFYFFGSTRNIEQPTSVTKSSVVNRRLPLLSSASGNNNYYPKGFIDISGGSYVNHAYTPSLPDYKVFAKSVFFDDIYPHASYKVLSVQKAYIPVKDDANQPTGERMPIYYVALYDSNDANRQAIAFNDWVGEKNGVEGQMVPTLVPSIAFRGGYLQGLEYELIYHRAGDKVSTYAADGTKSQLTLTANCFEIVFDTNANPRLPNDTIFPRGYTAGTYDGDDCTLFNIKMPASYILNAQLELETKALQYIADLKVDKSTYEMESDADNFERVTAFKELQLGHKVKMIYPQIMGRNLIQTQLLSYSTNRGIKGENVGDSWIKLSGTLTTGSYPEIFSIVKNFNEDNTIAAEENYTLSVVDESGILSSNGIRVVARVCVAGSTTLKEKYTVSSTPKTIDMTGGWLARLSLYCEANKSGIEINGRIRIKLEKGAVAHPWTPAPEENGQSVLSRVISIERCLDLPCDCVITLGYSAKQGNIKTLREIIADTSDKTETVIREGEKNKAQILGLRNGYRAQQEALDTYFDPDGSFDGSRIKPETIQTGALAVGAKSQQFTLSGVQMSVAKYSSGNGTLSWVCDSGKLAHFSLDDEYTLIWPMATGTQALNNANAHYIYAKCAKDGFGAASGGIKTNSNNGTFVATAEQIKFDSDNNYYYFLVGTVSSAQTDSDSLYKTRIISMTYGMTTINGKQITTGVIRSSDSNHGVVINLDTGEIIGKIKFRTSQGTDVNAETYISDTANAAAQTAVNNIEIGGRNLLRGTQNLTFVSSGGNWPNAKFNKSGTGTIANVTILEPPAAVPSVSHGIKLTTTTANLAIGFAQSGVPLLKNTLIQSVWVKGTAGDKITLLPLYSATSGEEESGTKTFTIPDSNWHRYEFSKTPNHDHASGVSAGCVYFSSATVDHYCTVCAEKLEYGNKATDWTPAPEDTEAALTALQTDLQNQIDGKIETWSQVADPSSAWITTALKDKHVNDLWYYTGESTDTRTNNKTYKYTKSGSTYSWAEYSAGGGDLFDRIDGKAAIFYGSPSGTYEDVEEGDFLVDEETGISYKRLNNAWVKVQDYQEAIANIKISGRNLHKDSESLGSSWIKTNATVSDGVATLTRTSTEARVYQMPASAYWTWNADTEYAVSVEAKAEVSGVKLQIDPYGANATPKNIELTTEWKRYTFVFKSGTSVTSGSISYRANDNNSVIYVRKPKLEKGNKATDWTPAPEDTEAELAAMQTDLKTQIDSKIETWSQSADPSTNWTAAEKTAHTGDLWQYTGSTTSTRTQNATYRWSGSAWVEQQASQELFNKINGKAAIWYGSTSDHPAQGETVNNGDFLVDGTTGKTYKYAPTQTPNVNGWVNVQDYQTPISQLNTKISNITDDGIISGGKEKYQLKGEWLDIAGSNGAGTIDGSYYTIKQKASPISGSTQSLDTAFSALKAKMDIILTSMSTDTTLDDLSLDADSFNALWKAYYDAETALENTIQSFYDDRIRRNLQASCATAEGTQAKVITCAEWKDGFFTTGTKLLVRFDNANTNQHPLISVNGKLGFIRYNNTLSGYRFPEYAETTAPMWLGESVIQLEYAGTGHAEWTDGQGQTQRYPANGDYHIWQMPDEGAFKSSQVLQRSIKGQTDIIGGLILTETIALRNAQGDETAGMTGITEANDVAMYAGGDLRSAQNGTASVIIKKTGDAKFGAVKINGSGSGEMIMDSGGVRRLSIKNEPLKLEEQGVTYNADNSYNDNSPTSGTALSGGSVTTAEKTHNIFTYGMIQSPAHQYVFDVHLTINKVTIAVTTAGGAGYITAVLEFYNGSEWAYVDSWELYNGQVRTYEKSDLSYLMRYANPTGYAYMGLRLRYKTEASSAGTATVSLRAPKWYYYCDQNKANMQIANDGICYYLNSANQFVVKTNNDQSLTIKARGEIDIAGVLWAGRIGKTSGFDSFYKNSAKYASNDIAVSHTSGQATYTITHRLGTDEYSVSVVPIDSSTTRSFRISARGTSTFTITFSAETEFLLTIFGKN